MNPVGIDDDQLQVIERESVGETFASAEARYAYEKAKRLRTVLRTVSGILGLAVFGAAMYWLGGGGRGGAIGGDSGGGGGAIARLNVPPVGSPTAKVQILAVVPAGTDCHSGIIKFVGDMAKEFPDRLRAEFMSMDEYGEDALVAKLGEVCAAVFVNGKSAYEGGTAGAKRTISLMGTETTHYSLADVGAVITHVYRLEYGDPPVPLYTPPPAASDRKSVV